MGVTFTMKCSNLNVLTLTDLVLYGLTVQFSGSFTSLGQTKLPLVSVVGHNVFTRALVGDKKKTYSTWQLFFVCFFNR